MSQTAVMIAAGGTGGHVFPGLALAEVLRAQNFVVTWVGTRSGIENKLVPKADIPLDFIHIKGVRGKGIKSLLIAPFQLLQAVKEALDIIKKRKPSLIICLGGYASGPIGIAAWLTRTPLVLHEQNAIPGMTNRVLQYVALRVFSSFPNAFKPSDKIVVTGNPVRENIATLPDPAARFADRSGPLRLLILGGSMGATRLNELVPQALSSLSFPIEVWHQCGEAHLEKAQSIYQATSLNYRLSPFIDNMSDAYAWADLVICRAGATTITELMAAGLGAILIPYPFAVDDHQTVNGEFLVSQGAAILLQQNALSPAQLAEKITELNTRAHCLSLAIAARKLFVNNAAINIVNYCKESLRVKS